MPSLLRKTRCKEHTIGGNARISTGLASCQN
jgi:hypothetical protein